MSATPVSSVKFTKAQYTATNKKEIHVTDKKEVGTVIYVDNDDNAVICTETNGEYKKGNEKFKLPQSHGLMREKYYVVINDDPCVDENNAKKFFECQSITAQQSSTLQQVPVNEGEKEAPFELATEEHRVASPATKMTKLNVYKCYNMSVKTNNTVDCTFIYKRDVDLNTIINYHVSQQNRILQTITNNVLVTELGTKIKTIYETIKNYISGAQFFENYIKEITGNDKPVITQSLELTFPNKNLSTAQANFRKKINSANADKANNYVLDDIIILTPKLHIFAKQINNFAKQVTKDDDKQKLINKFIYVLLSNINNLFYIWLISFMDANNISAPIKTINIKKYITSITINNINILPFITNLTISTLSNNYIILQENTPNDYYFHGIDESIISLYRNNSNELFLSADNEKTKLKVLQLGNYVIQNATSAKIKGLQKMQFTGGSRKTKKRNQISKKQSRKTKKLSRK